MHLKLSKALDYLTFHPIPVATPSAWAYNACFSNSLAPPKHGY